MYVFGNKPRSLFTLSLGLLMVSGLGACTKANDVATQAGGQTDKEFKKTELRSTWKSNCSQVNVLANWFGIPSQKIEYDFGASHTATTLLFREENCQTALVKIVEIGNYSLGDRVNENTYNLDVHFDTVAIMPMNDDGMTVLNAIHACGFADWKVGQSKEVTEASSASPVISRCWVKTPRNVYDLVLLTGDQLKIGVVKEGRDKSSPESRPNEIDQSRTFTKLILAE